MGRVNEKCNYNCGYCFANFGAKEKVLSLEDNKKIVDNLTDSETYIVIDPLGYIKDNSKNDNYVSIGNLLNESFVDVMEKLELNITGYNERLTTKKDW